MFLYACAPCSGRFHAVRKAIHDARPDAVVAFLDTMNITVLLATRGLGIPVIVSERIDPAAHRHRIGRFKSALRRLTYRWAERVVVQTRRAADFFADLPSERLVVIPNPVPSTTLSATPESPGPDGRLRILAVGKTGSPEGFRPVDRGVCPDRRGFSRLGSGRLRRGERTPRPGTPDRNGGTGRSGCGCPA